MRDGGIRPGVWAAVLGSLATLGAVLFMLDAGREPQRAMVATQEPPSATAVDEQPLTPSKPVSALGDTRRKPAAAAQEDPVPYIEGELYGDLDLGEVRAALPDNLYWELGVPTKDPQVLEAREQEKTRRNEEYGRVLSGDANEAEVNAYYDYRQRLSSDYLEFADYVRRRFGEKLSEQFNGMLNLAIKLNRERLAQIPADREDALVRSRVRAKIREEWQREQAEFEPSAR